MKQYFKLTPDYPPVDQQRLQMENKAKNQLSSKQKWITWFLILMLAYMLIQYLYLYVIQRNSDFHFVQPEIAMLVVLSFLFVFIAWKTSKKSSSQKKEIMLLKETLTKKNRSIENLVLFSERQKSKLINTVLLKERLLSIISHDMRLSSETLKKMISNYEKGHISSRVLIIGVLEAKNELLKMDDILTGLLSLPENAEAAPERQMINVEKVNEVMESTLHLYKRSARNKKIDIIPYIQLPVGMCLCIPMSELEIILRSLVSNAIKFSGNESIIIITLKAETGTHGSVATLSVKDFGRGMRPSTLNLINGTRAISGMSALDEVGLGIGLRIVFDVINNNNLQYNIESEIEKGTKFSVNIPLVTC